MPRFSYVSLFVFLATIAGFGFSQTSGGCAYVDTRGNIRNTCTFSIRITIERRFFVSSGMHSVEKSEIVTKQLSPNDTWRPEGSGFTIIREEK